MSRWDYRTEHRWGFREGCSSAQSLPVRPQGAGVLEARGPQPSERTGGASFPRSGQATRKSTDHRGQPHPWAPHEHRVLCVGCRGVAWLMLWGGLNWPGDKGGLRVLGASGRGRWWA